MLLDLDTDTLTHSSPETGSTADLLPLSISAVKREDSEERRDKQHKMHDLNVPFSLLPGSFHVFSSSNRFIFKHWDDFPKLA